MSLTYTLVRERTTLASATFASPWNDIPLHRLLLSVPLDGELPKPADWSLLPGSPDGVDQYKEFAALLSRWADSTPASRTAIDRSLDCELAKIVISGAEPGQSVTRADVVPMLESLIARLSDRYPTELSLALTLLGLCHALTEDAAIIRSTAAVPRTHDGPIDYYTSNLEGFDTITAVEVLDAGRGISCRFASGYTYRIPLDYLREWLQIEPADTITAARRTAGGTDIRLQLQSGQTQHLSANAVLRYCEPQYTDASPRTPREQQLLDRAIATGSLVRAVATNPTRSW